MSVPPAQRYDAGMRHDHDPKSEPPDPPRSPEQRREDRLDEELEESFPASDPTSPGSVLPGNSRRQD
jgi:hypothetical protein